MFLVSSRDRLPLQRDEIRFNRHRALGFLIEHDLFGKPLHTFPDHAPDLYLRNAVACARAAGPVLAMPNPQYVEVITTVET
jgi:hypothetical protein